MLLRDKRLLYHSIKHSKASARAGTASMKTEVVPEVSPPADAVCIDGTLVRPDQQNMKK